MESKPLICWDTSILIDWITGNSDIKNGIQAIQSVIDAVETDNCILIASILIYVEVLESTMPAGCGDRFEQFVQNKDKIKIVAVDFNVIKRAQAIRNQHTKIKTPDAIHIATAVVYKVNFLHTFDAQILALSGTPTVNGLIINKCEIPGVTLKFV